MPSSRHCGRASLVVPLMAALVLDAATHLTHAQAAPVSPVTVADLIGMTTIGSHIQGDGTDDYDAVSPNGSGLAVVVQRGNLARNTVDFALLLFPVAGLLQAPKPDTVALFASSSGRPGIAHVTWLADNATLAFLGERPDELPQVYTLDVRTRTLTQRTHATTVITAFDIADLAGGRGNLVVYAAETSQDTSSYAAKRTHGFVVPPFALVSDVIAGSWMSWPSWEAKAPRVVHVVRSGGESTVPVPDSGAGYRSCELQAFPTLSIAPSGDVALLECKPLIAPAAWKGYQQKLFRKFADEGVVYPQYVLVDLTTGHARPLTEAPVDYGSTMVWAPDGRSVVLANAMLPLDVTDAAERAVRTTRELVAEVDVHTGAVTVIVHRDSLAVLAWDPRTQAVALEPGAYLLPTETRRVYYRKTAGRWREVPRSHRVIPSVPAVVIDQGLNTPARLVAADLRTGRRRVIYDPNPTLLAAHKLGHEEVVHWKTRARAEWVGGLYRPPNYRAGRRYPLVIQQHGFDSTEFWPYGVFSTGEAAQPLANLDIMVLQIPDPPPESLTTPHEALLSMEGVEGAIDQLDSLGLIDRTKVGLQGFSRTCYYTLYFLTHSRYSVAAATLTDGVDFSYLQYLVFEPVYLGLHLIQERDRIYGGPPFGPSLTAWIERAPGFALDRVTAPVQLTALSGLTLLEEWEPYAGLLLQGKPAELVYLPQREGYTHILVNPQERLTSEQGAVDWFCFWLQGYEDPEPAKSEQYARWHHLREMRDSTETRRPRAP